MLLNKTQLQPIKAIFVVAELNAAMNSFDYNNPTNNNRAISATIFNKMTNFTDKNTNNNTKNNFSNTCRFGD